MKDTDLGFLSNAIANGVVNLIEVFIIMCLWNILMPRIFDLPIINYWQALGLYILVHRFFGGGYEIRLGDD